MSKDKMAELEQALKPKLEEKPEHAPTLGSYTAPSRVGKVNLTVHLPKNYKRSLRLIQANTGRSMQSLVAEALNDLYIKYGAPTVDGD